ncbi:uncharacterized protein [Watersipora subatra]|uniref:uncharacterized protein isoform X2 n=1 Tax=Watersipora subatra TaxID=2589382 RepID=UPI00355B71FD
MIGWSIVSIFKPWYWFTRLWPTTNGGTESPLFTSTDMTDTTDTYNITQDSCSKCNRFLSYHSKNNGYCSFHNVAWTLGTTNRSFEMFRNPFEMWLRSRCGGDMEEGQISTNLLTLSSFMHYAETHSQAHGNAYDFCDESFCDYRMVHDFLLDMRLQAKERHTVETELRICDAMQRFIEFRKFQLPIKGIIENRYSATERVLQTYKSHLLANSRGTVDLQKIAISSAGVKAAIGHFMPQFDIIIDYLQCCQNVRSMENGCDIEFTTSFLCLFLYSLMPEHLSSLHMLRVRDLHLNSDSDAVCDDQRSAFTELPQFVSRSCEDLASPIEASACIGKLQKCLTLDEQVKAVVSSYVTFIRPRISKTNDYVLLSSSALGLTCAEVEERIVTLVYRVTGKVTNLVGRFEEEIEPLPMRSLPSPLKRGRVTSVTKNLTVPVKRQKTVVSSSTPRRNRRHFVKKIFNKYSMSKKWRKGRR